MFKIVFVGIILFMEVTGGRDVAVLDLSKGKHMHGHDIRPHEAQLMVRGTSIKDVQWPNENMVNCKEAFRCFPLTGDALTIEGLPLDPPLEVAVQHRCLIPHLPLECPTFDLDKTKAMDGAAATLQLTSGYLTARRDNPPYGPITSVWSHPSKDLVTVSVKVTVGPVKKLVLKPDAELYVVNSLPPGKKEDVPNHFLAYYALGKKDYCCTNVPFPIRPDGCAGFKEEEVDLGILPYDPRLTTIACSNSGYP